MMSCMAQVVQGIWSGVPSFNQNVSRHEVSCLIGTTNIELCVFKKKKEKKNMDKMAKFFLVLIFTFGAFY